MYLSRSIASGALFVALCLSAVTAQTSLRKVKVLGEKNAVEIEIEATDRLTPQTRVLTGPDRLVIDFPNAVMGAGLRNQTVNRGQVKTVRVGLFQSKPPIARVVLDLKTAQSFQVFPAGRTVIIKVTGDATAAASGAGNEVDDFPPVTRPGLVATNYKPGAASLAPALAPRIEEPKLDVTFRNGLLSIKSNKASLSEIMFAVHQRTGAEIAVASGAEQEQVAADIGPAPAAEVIAHLLNGSKFNFLIISSATTPGGIERVILTPRGEGGISAPLQPIAAAQPDDQNNDDFPQPQETTPPPAVPIPPPNAEPLPPRTPPDTRPQGADDTTPDQ